MSIAARMDVVGLDVDSYCLFSYYINDLFFSLFLQPSVTRYDFVFKGTCPFKDSIGEYNFHVCYMCVECLYTYAHVCIHAPAVYYMYMPVCVSLVCIYVHVYVHTCIRIDIQGVCSTCAV